MKICIIGNGLVGLSLAKALVNKNIAVDVFYTKKHIKYDQTRTLGISKSNLEYFNKNILNIKKILWEIKNIRVNSENFNNKEILNFSNNNSQLFSILQNHKLYDLLHHKLNKHRLFNFKKNLDLKKLLKLNYKLIINCDFNHDLTKKFFSKKFEKKYNSFAYITTLDHKKIIQNNTAVQIFTNNGPLAFLPISNIKTSIVYSFRSKTSEDKFDFYKLIKKFNPKYQIIKMNGISKFELRSSNLRRYYKDNILAFGDLLHKIHPLAGQGFNMSVRDIKELISLIDDKVNLGLDIDNTVCIDFQNRTKDKNYLFSKGIDWIYEFFNLDSKIKNDVFSRYINFISKNKLINGFLKKIADTGF